MGVGRDTPEPDGFVDTIPEPLHIRMWCWPERHDGENDSQYGPY